MSNVIKTYIELCLEGLADLTDIDDYIEKWHLSDLNVPIHDYLGMTRDEYALWVEKPEALRFILFSHRYGFSLKEAITQMEDWPLAARAVDANELDAVMKWLRRTGEIG